MGEEVKLHLGCGTVYLDGWVNIDVQRAGALLASEHPEEVAYNRTTIDKYYRHDMMDAMMMNGRVVVDEFADITALPHPANSVDEILVVGAFEHIDPKDVKSTLECWYRILKPGGVLYIDVPDLIGTLELLRDSAGISDDCWAIRLIYGSQKDEYSYHKWGYTPTMLKRLCEARGFLDCQVVDFIKHDYPMFTMACGKGLSSG